MEIDIGYNDYRVTEAVCIAICILIYEQAVLLIVTDQYNGQLWVDG